MECGVHNLHSGWLRYHLTFLCNICLFRDNMKLHCAIFYTIVYVQDESEFFSNGIIGIANLVHINVREPFFECTRCQLVLINAPSRITCYPFWHPSSYKRSQVMVNFCEKQKFSYDCASLREFRGNYPSGWIPTSACIERFSKKKNFSKHWFLQLILEKFSKNLHFVNSC